MAELQEFPFAALANEAITADQDACHREICPPERVLDGTEPESVRGMWVHLRSDTKEDRAQRKAWPRKLPEFENLECLSINGCTPELFEATCELPKLRRLSVVRGRISDLNTLRKSRTITHFFFCGGPRINSLEGLREVHSLKGLTLVGNFKSVRTLEPLGNLSKLESLCLGANDFSRNTYESLEPVGSLDQLRHFSIFSTKVKRGGISPIGRLLNLEYLQLLEADLKCWSKSDYVLLNKNLRKLNGNLIELAATDAEFQQKHGIY